ncbi:MAG TPA: trypsin-like peptidase domain-containing protein, partial [Planctomycetota bacterium]|nr:trypsin-like peptidase domain-containing protein [Planctomycetota bacterium]
MRRVIPVALVLAVALLVSGPSGAQTQLKALNRELVEIAEKVTPSVVAIEVTPPAALEPKEGAADVPAPGEGPRGVWGQLRLRPPEILGSGILMTADGAILTSANHFRGRSEADVTVTLADGRRLDGKLLAKDLRTGLAVVKVDARDLPAVKLAAKSPPAGSLVVTVSHPAGLGSTVRLGMVSATDRSVTGLGPDIVGATQYSGLLQITTPVSAPDLGGLVVDL